MIKKKGIKNILTILFICSLMLFVSVGCNNDKVEKNYISVEVSSDSQIKSVGEDFIVPYATILDSNDDRVDDVEIKVVWGTKESTVKRSVEQGTTVRCLQIGEWQMIYSAENCDDYIINVHACKKLDTPENLKVEDKKLSWDSVEDATGYIITFYGEEGIRTENTYYESERFNESGWYVYVSAVGDEDEYIESDKAEKYQTKKAPIDYIALFDNPASLTEIVGTEYSGDPQGDNGYLDFRNVLKQVSYETEQSEKFVRIRTLSNPNNGMFSVKLNNVIKGEDRYLDYEAKSGGIEIKFRLNKSSTSDELYFQLANHSNGSRLGCYEKEDATGYGVKIEAGKWQTLKLSFELFDERYDETDDVINLNIRGQDIPANSVFELDLQYIKYYYTFPSPKNLQFNSDFSTLTWQSVENAEGYIIEINSKKIECDKNTTSIVFDEYQDSDSIVRVSAKTTSERYIYSEQSTIVYHKLFGKEIATMDNATYEQDFCGAKWPEADFSICLSDKRYMEESGTKFVRLDMITNEKNTPFAVSILKNLCLEEYDGIEIKCRLSSGIGSNLYFQACRNEKGERTGATEVDTTNGVKLVEGQWQTIKIPMGLFKSYYPEQDTLDGTRLQFNLRSEKDLSEPFKLVFDVDYIRYYEALETPQISLIEKVVHWSAIEGADRYIVNINGEDKATVNVTSYDITSILDDAESDVFVQVKAIDSTGINSDSEYSNAVGKKVLGTKEIATFNSTLYVNDFIDKSNDSNFIDGVSCTSAPTDIAYLSQQGNGGSVYVALAESAKSRVNGLFIKLDSKLDLVNNAGITIRFKVEYNAGYEDLYVQFGDTTCLNGGSWDKNGDAVLVVKNTWQTLTLSSEKLLSAGYGYTANSDELALVFRRDSGLYVGLMDIYLDDISYYSGLAVPTNVSISGNTVSWDSVENANQYIVNINGTEYTTTGTSYDFTDKISLGDLYIKVKASDSTGTNADSGYSEVLGKKVLGTNEIATFNSSLYENDFIDKSNNGDFITGGGTTPWTSAPTDIAYLSQEGNGGSVYVALAESSKSNVNGLFIKLDSKLDLVNNAGIKLRFKISYGAGYEDLYVQFGDTTCLNGDSWNKNGDAVLVVKDTWQTLTLSSEKLLSASYGYTANSDEIALVFRRGSEGYVGAMAVYIDDISYLTD